MSGGSKKRKLIDEAVVHSLRLSGLGWNQVAKHPDVNVCRQTLRNWRIESGFVGPWFTAEFGAFVPLGRINCDNLGKAIFAFLFVAEREEVLLLVLLLKPRDRVDESCCCWL